MPSPTAIDTMAAAGVGVARRQLLDVGGAAAGQQDGGRDHGREGGARGHAGGSVEARSVRRLAKWRSADSSSYIDVSAIE